MAKARLARRISGPQGRPPPLLVGIIGSAYLRYGLGVPHPLRDLGVDRVVKIPPLSTPGYAWSSHFIHSRRTIGSNSGFVRSAY